MTRAQAIAVLLLIAIAVSSGIAVAYVKHQNRKLFAEREALRAERDELAVEWRQHQLELATFAAHGRVETLAREKLGMRVPGWDEIRIIER